MALEAIQTIQRAEQAAQRLCGDASAATRQRISKAEQEGLRTIDNARREAQQEAAALLAQAEAEAAQRLDQTKQQAKQDCQSLSQTARERLDSAAALIVGRVVNGSCPSSE